MPVVQIIRAGWANPYVKQAAMTLVIEGVLPEVVAVTNEKIIPAAKHTAKEKIVPAVKSAASKTHKGLNSLKKCGTTNRYM